MKLIHRPSSAPYGTLARETLQTPELSLKEKGMLAVVFSLPEDWAFTVTGLSGFLIRHGAKRIARCSHGKSHGIVFLNGYTCIQLQVKA